jgi:8-oxo-dGTP pyrophosphatase MutT (NUDIX family)
MATALAKRPVAKKKIPITRQPYQRRRRFNSEFMVKAVQVALRPDSAVHIPEKDREMVKAAAAAITRGASIPALGAGNRGRGSTAGPPSPISVTQLAAEAGRALRPSSGTVPADIEVALRRQGIDWVEPFAPGRPLTPYYGYGRRLRQIDYRVGRNITTDTRPDRLPFALLKQLNEGYDIASICIRHIINDMRAMKLSFGPMDDYDGDVAKEILVVKQFLRKPDGNRPFPIWLAQWMMDILRYDAGTLYRERNAAGKLVALKVVDGTTVAPIVDYYGDRPIPPAPFLQQFVQGIPWDWASTDDVIYEPHWPLPESPYGVAPAETIVLNANTDVRLQLFFLQFFTAGVVPEMLIEAPEEMTDSDAVAELQEDWDNFYESNQTGRHGAHWVPAGSKPHPYKPDKFDPHLAEYVMRRSVAAFGLVPQDLGFTETVNRATAEAQADTQFRISTLPNTEIYEAIINMVIQDDLQMPVEVNFDTGREKKDRLMEAQAHQIYVGIGSESPDEVRDQILGLPVDNDNRLPRFYDSPRLGPVPLAWIKSVSGMIDPSTLSPYGPIPAQPFVPIAGQKENVPPEEPEDLATSSDDKGSTPKKTSSSQQSAAAPSAASAAAPPPLLPVGTKPPPNTAVEQPGMHEKDTHEQVGDMHTDPEGRISPDGRHGLPTVKLQGARARNEYRVDDGKLGAPTAGTTEGSRGPRRPQGSSSPSGRMGISVSTRENARTPRRNSRENGANKMEGGVVSASGLAGVDGPNVENVVDDDDDAVKHFKTIGERDLDEPSDIMELARKSAMEASLFSVLEGIHAMPGYGDLWWNEGSCSVWLSLGDGDESEKYREAESRLKSVPGVKSVTVEAEAYPARDGEDGWKRLGYIGNWLSDDAKKELATWRGSARKKAKDGKRQRKWDPKDVPQEVADYINNGLQNTTNTAEVDKVFESALQQRPPNPPPEPMDVHHINGLALRAGDTGRVLMLQRAMTQGDPAAGMWEFPGGHKSYNETDKQGAIREWSEETGIKFPKKKAQLFSTWTSFNGRYTGWVFEIPTESDVQLDGREEVVNPDGDWFEAVAWFDPRDLSNHPGIRPELKADIASVQSALRWPRKKNMVGLE